MQACCFISLPSRVHIAVPQWIHLPVKEYLNHFQYLAAMNIAAINIQVQIFVETETY